MVAHRRPGRGGRRGPVEGHRVGLRAAGHRRAAFRRVHRPAVGADDRRGPRVAQHPGVPADRAAALRGAPDDDARRRAVLLWLLNPLLLYELVSGAHVDARDGFVLRQQAFWSSRGRGWPRASCSAAPPRSSCRRSPCSPALSGPAGTPARSRCFPCWAALLPFWCCLLHRQPHALGRTPQAGSLASWATPWRAGSRCSTPPWAGPASRTVMCVVALRGRCGLRRCLAAQGVSPGDDRPRPFDQGRRGRRVCLLLRLSARRALCAALVRRTGLGPGRVMAPSRVRPGAGGADDRDGRGLRHA